MALRIPSNMSVIRTSTQPHYLLLMAIIAVASLGLEFSITAASLPSVINTPIGFCSFNYDCNTHCIMMGYTCGHCVNTGLGMSMGMGGAPSCVCDSYVNSPLLPPIPIIPGIF
jgi:hypothetical protein